MPEYNVSAKVELSLDMDIRDVNSPEEAEKEMRQYLDNSANIESDYFDHIMISDYEIGDINEND
jgi:hypothetical protein